VADLMAWNAMDDTSILKIGQKLLLQVTPPATITPTPAPATATQTATAVPPTPTLTLTPTQAALSPTAAPRSTLLGGKDSLVWYALIGLGVGGLVLVVFFSRKK
jgi:hypothetical protein